jgi:hypothetical protein
VLDILVNNAGRAEVVFVVLEGGLNRAIESPIQALVISTEIQAWQ